MEFCHRHDNDFKSVRTFILRQLRLPFFCLLTIFYHCCPIKKEAKLMAS